MKEINIYKVKVIEVPEDIELASVVRNIEVAAYDMKQVINTLTDGCNPFCKKQDIKSIEFDKTVYTYNFI